MMAAFLNFFKKDRKSHWEEVYRKRSSCGVSWYQPYPELSLKLIAAADIPKESNIIDVGAGASMLVDFLIRQGCSNITVLDISKAALDSAKKRLVNNAAQISWIEADITKYKFNKKFCLWHDRAVFHFLSQASDRKAYLETLNSALKVGGHLIISAFNLEGPPKCSGLEVVRYSPESLSKEIGANFILEESAQETHLTPTKIKQKFIYCRFKKID